MKMGFFFEISSEFGDFSADGGVTKGGDASGCEIAAVVRHRVVSISIDEREAVLRN